MGWLNAVVAAGFHQAIKSAQTRTSVLVTRILANTSSIVRKKQIPADIKN